MQPSFGVHVKRLVVPVYTPMALVSLAVAAPSAAFPQYLGMLGASVAMVGVVISLRGFGNMVSDLPGGLVLGRFRYRRVVQISLLLATGLSVAMALVRNVAAIATLVFLTGAMNSIVVTAMMAYVRVAVPATSRGRALSLTGGSVRIGALIGPIAGGILADAYGVPMAIGLQAACFAIAFVAFSASRDRGVEIISHHDTKNGERRGIRSQLALIADALRGRGVVFLMVGFAILMLQLLRSSRTILLPLWGDRLGLSATLIGSVMSIGAALELLLFVPSGIIMDRAGRKIAGSLCIGFFSFGVLALVFAQVVPAFFAASLLIGFGNGFGSGINMTIGTDLAPTGAVSEFLGMWRLFGDIGTSAGPAIVGSIATSGGLPTAVIATALLGFTGLVVMLLGPETLRLADRNEEGA